MSGGGNRNNGVSFNVINLHVVLSIVWLLASLGIVILGVWHCRSYALYSSIKCSETRCELSIDRAEPIFFLRKDFHGSNNVRTLNDNVVDTAEYREMRKKKTHKSKFGNSVELKFMYSAEDIDSRYKAEKVTMFTKQDMGSSTARRVNRQITKYIGNDIETLNEYTGGTFTAIGTITVILGIMSSVISCMFGTWADPTPRRFTKKSG